MLVITCAVASNSAGTNLSDEQKFAATTPDCAVIEQANVVAGTQGLNGHRSTRTVKFLGTFEAPQQCEEACNANSTANDPCRSWAFYFPDSPSRGYASACYGRHDDVWYCFDDDIVSAIEPDKVKETVVQPCAYALLYRQRR